MKKLLLLGLFAFTIGCSSDDPSEDTISTPAAMELDAVGTLSEQTAEEAKRRFTENGTCLHLLRLQELVVSLCMLSF